MVRLGASEGVSADHHFSQLASGAQKKPVLTKNEYRDGPPKQEINTACPALIIISLLLENKEKCKASPLAKQRERPKKGQYCSATQREGTCPFGHCNVLIITSKLTNVVLYR